MDKIESEEVMLTDLSRWHRRLVVFGWMCFGLLASWAIGILGVLLDLGCQFADWLVV